MTDTDTLTRDHLPKQIHNPTKHTPWPMSDRDWLSMVSAIYTSWTESGGTKTWPAYFDDPDLPTSGPELIAMWTAFWPVRDAWVDKVGLRRATKWREANDEQKGRELRHASLWAAGNGDARPYYYCASQEQATWFMTEEGYETFTHVLRRDVPGGEWRIV